MSTREQREKAAAAAHLTTHAAYEAVLVELAELRLRKVAEYGESRYQESCAEFNRWMCFSDVHRKYIRLRRQVLRKDVAGLRETYMDLANYAIMAAQLLEEK